MVSACYQLHSHHISVVSAPTHGINPIPIISVWYQPHSHHISVVSTPFPSYQCGISPILIISMWYQPHTHAISSPCSCSSDWTRLLFACNGHWPIFAVKGKSKIHDWPNTWYCPELLWWEGSGPGMRDWSFLITASPPTHMSSFYQPPSSIQE